MRNKRIISIFIILVMMAINLAGCGGSSGGGGKAKILVSIHDETDTFLSKLVEAIQKKAGEKGVTVDVVSFLSLVCSP